MKENTRKTINTCRRNLLNISDEEVKTRFRKSNVLLNGDDAKSLINFYEQRYFITYKETITKNKSLKTKSEASLRQGQREEDLSFFQEQHKVVFKSPLRKLSLSKSKLLINNSNESWKTKTKRPQNESNSKSNILSDRPSKSSDSANSVKSVCKVIPTIPAEPTPKITKIRTFVNALLMSKEDKNEDKLNENLKKLRKISLKLEVESNVISRKSASTMVTTSPVKFEKRSNCTNLCEGNIEYDEKSNKKLQFHSNGQLNKSVESCICNNCNCKDFFISYRRLFDEKSEIDSDHMYNTSNQGIIIFESLRELMSSESVESDTNSPKYRYKFEDDELYTCTRTDFMLNLVGKCSVKQDLSSSSISLHQSLDFDTDNK